MSTEPLIRADGLGLSLPDRGARAGRLGFGKPPLLDILQDIDLSLGAGESVGLVGESGSGKTSLGCTLMRLYRPTAGRLTFEGRDITGLEEGALRPLRADMQFIFQDPQSSLNPRARIGDILSQPLHAFGRAKGRRDAWSQASALLERVGLPPSFAGRYPHELSGGQRQRVGIARAIALKPRLVVADEVVSGLDVSSQAQILALLNELKRDLGLALVFISHDLSVVRVLCDRVVVLRHGRIVEEGSCESVFAAPRDPYTQELLAAIPLPEVQPGWIFDDGRAAPDQVDGASWGGSGGAR